MQGYLEGLGEQETLILLRGIISLVPGITETLEDCGRRNSDLVEAAQELVILNYWAFNEARKAQQRGIENPSPLQRILVGETPLAKKFIKVDHDLSETLAYLER